MASNDSPPGLFEAIVASMADGVLLCRIDDGTICFTNPYFDALFGYAPGELTGTSLATLGGFESFAVADRVREQGTWAGEMQNIRKDGTAFWSSVNASLLHCDPYGQILLLVQRDITAEHALEEALEESEDLRRRAQILSLIGHWRLNPYTTHLTGTEELYQIFEVPHGSPLEEFDKRVHPEDRESVGRIMQKTIENRGRYDSTYRLVMRSGKIKWVHAIGEGIFDEAGTLTTIAGSVQDITALKVAEDELQKMLKLKSLGVMAGGIAHDFNNINTLLFGSISLAKSRLDERHPAWRDLEVAEKALQRATNLSNQLLTFAKGGEPLKKTVDLRRLIDEVTKLDLKTSHIRLDFTAAPDLWLVFADAGQLEQVIMNLAINAIQAMPDGGTLHIRLDNVTFDPGDAKRLEPGDYVRIEVADEGEGIPDEIMLQIFDPYFTTKKTGSGLGLATVYSIVQKHGGHIEVASKVEQGTTVVIFLPVSQSLQEDVRADAEMPQEDVSISGRVLVMDDEQDVCEVVKSILEFHGFVVESAAEGAEAISKYQEALLCGRAFDCVIMDLTIQSGVGGKEAVAEILKLHPEAKVVVSSGYAEDTVMANYAEFGFKAVIPKPYTAQLLTRTVKDVMRQVN